MHDEIQELTSDNKGSVFGEYTEQYILPAVGSLAACRLTVKSASFASVSKYQRLASGVDHNRAMSALCELIADSAVSSSLHPIWSPSEVASLSSSNTARFLELQQIVINHNKMDGDQSPVQKYIDGTMGN